MNEQQENFEETQAEQQAEPASKKTEQEPWTIQNAWATRKDKSNSTTTRKTISVNKIVGISLAAFAALVVIIIIAVSIGSSGGSGGGSADLTAGSATANQVCQTMVGQTLQNTLTGQSSGTQPVSFTGASIQSNLNGSGNEVVSCDYTLDTGADFPATVTLFANGSTGLTGGY
jgi:hypothetical protein